MILTTHHHPDHVEANLALKQRFGLKIVGPTKEEAKIPGIDETVAGGSTFRFGGEEVRVIFTPGHTAAMSPIHFPDSKVLFAADTLFALGCGRLLEGTAAQMWQSLKTLSALPPSTPPSIAAMNTRSPTPASRSASIRTTRRWKERAAEDRPAARRRQADPADDDRPTNWRPTRSCARTIRKIRRTLGMGKVPRTRRCSPRSASARTISTTAARWPEGPEWGRSRPSNCFC